MSNCQKNQKTQRGGTYIREESIIYQNPNPSRSQGFRNIKASVVGRNGGGGLCKARRMISSVDDGRNG
jgi:hypothetical protein